MLRFALSIALAATLLAGVGVTAQDAVPLTFAAWAGAEEESVLRALVDQFNAENSDVQVELQLLPNYVSDLNASIEDGTPPDIALIPDYEFWTYAAQGALVNLQAQLGQSAHVDVAAFWPPALDRFRFDAATLALGAGDLYALPKDVGPMVLYINEDLFAAADVPLPDPNVPMTWDELVAVATRLTLDENGRTPADAGFDPNAITQYGLGDLRWEIAVYGNGGRIVSEDGRTFVAAADTRTLQALQWLSDLRHVHHVAPLVFESDEVTPPQMFVEGRAAMITDGRWQVPYLRSSLPFQWSIRPNPVGPSGQLTTHAGVSDCRFSGWSSATGISVMAGSDGEAHLPLAYRFVEFMASPEAQTALAALDIALPNQMTLATGAADDPSVNNATVHEAAACELSPPWTRTPYYGLWFDPLFWDGVWADVVLDNAMTATEAFAARADAFQQALDDAWAEYAGS